MISNSLSIDPIYGRLSQGPQGLTLLRVRQRLRRRFCLRLRSRLHLRLHLHLHLGLCLQSASAAAPALDPASSTAFASSSTSHPNPRQPCLPHRHSSLACTQAGLQCIYYLPVCTPAAMQPNRTSLGLVQRNGSRLAAGAVSAHLAPLVGLLL